VRKKYANWKLRAHRDTLRLAMLSYMTSGLSATCYTDVAVKYIRVRHVGVFLFLKLVFEMQVDVA